MKKLFLLPLLILTIGFSNISCSKNEDQDDLLTSPAKIDDGLQVASLATVGMSYHLLKNMVKDISDGKHGQIHSVLIVKDNYLVFEEYFAGFDKDRQHEMFSVSKSICSALMGVAIEKKFINSVNDPIYQYLQEYDQINWQPDKEKIKIKHLLTMSAGFDWDEWSTRYDNSSNSFYNMLRNPDPINFLLNKNIISDGGSKFTYNTGLTLLAGKIISNASGMDFDSFSYKYLFEPLRIHDYQWTTYGNGTCSVGSSLRLKPRDMAKFGLLYLNKGIWQGKQVIPESWINESTSNHISPWNNVYYGFFWWKTPITFNGLLIENYTAEGRAGQFIFVLPNLNMVVVFTGFNDDHMIRQPVTILKNYILPSVN